MATKAFHDPAPLDVLLAAIPSLPRPVLARLVTRMVDRLDQLDGEPDLEEDDWPGGAIEDEPEGHSVLLMPAYGIDQRRGPANEEEAVRDFLQAQHEEDMRREEKRMRARRTP